MRVLSVIFVLFLLFSCSKKEEGPFAIPDDAIESKTGLKYVDVKVGSGDAASPNRKIVVHYTGWLLEDGRKFDSSVDKNRPFEFDLGTGSVISGWDEGVTGMRVGGKRRLFLPSHLAYGERGIPGVIPPSATLVFDVELLEVK